MSRSFRRRALVRVLALALAAGLTPLALMSVARAAQDDIGDRAFRYGSPLTGEYIDPDESPTATKSQSKLWYAQGRWWGVLLSDASDTFHIHSYDAQSDAWSDTGVVVDVREQAKLDVLWDATAGTLYTIGAVDRTPTSSADAIRFSKFAFDRARGAYVQQGQSVAVNAGGVEAAVLTKDSENRIWVAYTAPDDAGGRNLRVVAGYDDGAGWSAPLSPPVPDVTGLSADDLAAVVAHGTSISVVWSKQVTVGDSRIVVATHADDAGTEEGWSSQEVVVGPGRPEDHLQMSVDGDGTGRVYIVAKDSTGEVQPGGARVRLFVVEDGKPAEVYTHSSVGDDVTRPAVAVDKDANRLRVFTTAPVAGGAVFEKNLPLSDLGDFPEGRGTPVLRLRQDHFVNNVTTTKQNRTPGSGLLLVASDQRTGQYVYNAEAVAEEGVATQVLFHPHRGTFSLDEAMFDIDNHFVDPALGAATTNNPRWVTEHAVASVLHDRTMR